MANRIENPYIMTREQVKTYLQISTTDFDTQIDTYLPIVSNDIELITNNNFVFETTGTISNGSPIITEFGNTEKLGISHVISSVDFDNLIISAIDDDNKTVMISASATTDASDTEILVNVFPIGKRPIAASMIMYNIKKYTQNIDLNGPLKRESVGSYSWSSASDGKGIAGYPEWIVRGLSDITRPRFY